MNERPEEAFARKLVEGALGVPLPLRDGNSSPGLYDYDILYPDRPSGALEVVRWADPVQIQSGKEWQRHVSEGCSAPTLRLSWMVVAAESRQVVGFDHAILTVT